MNKVILTGRLTRDPEMSYSQSSNLAIARFTLAVDRRYSKDEEAKADFFNCTAFSKTAEFIEKYFSKGMKMNVVGELQNDNYTNRNGEKVYGVKVIVSECEFGESKNAHSSTQTPTGGSDDDFVPADEAMADLPY